MVILVNKKDRRTGTMPKNGSSQKRIMSPCLFSIYIQLKRRIITATESV